MTFKCPQLILAALFVTASSGAASADTITFDSCAASGPSYVQDGVTFTGVGGTPLVGSSASPNGTCALLASTDFNSFSPIRADIAGGTSSVSVDLGDFGVDPDLLFLRIYNSSDVLLDEFDLAVDSSFIGMETLSLANPDIAYAIFGSEAPSVDGSSVYADNFTFGSAGAVPEPITLSLFGAGLAGAAAIRRRKKKSA